MAGKNNQKKMLVLGLDGVPYTFIKKLFQGNEMPFFRSLTERGSIQRMNSVLPPISSVAWSGFMTGEDPGGHNIFGFIDRKPDPFELFIPTAEHLRSPIIPEKLGKMGKRSIVLNVPITYPPREIEGIMVSGFLATDLKKATYPSSLAGRLAAMDYVIDVDTWVARRSKEKFMEDLKYALDRRFQTLFSFLQEEDWDYFHCHIMETDRLNHFFWQDKDENDNDFQKGFFDFYRQIDIYLEQLLALLPEGVELMILSDHGFCPVKKEVEINYWLKREGYLDYKCENPESVADIAPETRAYSLIPGRIFINRKGREEMGSVSDRDYRGLCQELKEKLLDLHDRETGDKIIREVYFSEEVYDGPFLSRAPDLIALPNYGYDLKGRVGKNRLLNNGFIQGMHTYNDAFIYLGNRDQNISEIRDIHNLIINFFK